MVRRMFFFFIGTEAELIKVFPVIHLFEKKGIEYRIISSGQNDISKSSVLREANGGRLDLILSDELTIKKTATGLLLWFIKTSLCAYKQVIQRFRNETSRDSIMIVHGDTISTVMGTYLGKKLGMRVAHIEAGLRSFHLFNPFPEEIDRMLVSRKADFHFAPNRYAVRNLNGKTNVFYTRYNTLIDSLAYSSNIACENEIIKSILNKKYFVFVLHRQENLENKHLIFMLLKNLLLISRKYQCVLILHKITEYKFKQLGILEKLKNDNRFVLLPRVDYFDFMKLLIKSEFVVTDGGSNQEELSYMGKPTLIIRKKTERNEGLGKNAVLYGGDKKVILDFFENYSHLKKTDVIARISPSTIIAQKLLKYSCINQ